MNFSMAQLEIFKWNVEKKQVLAMERGIAFDEIVQRIEIGAKVIETYHPNSRYLQRRAAREGIFY